MSKSQRQQQRDLVAQQAADSGDMLTVQERIENFRTQAMLE